MPNVTDNGDGQIFEGAFGLPDRQHVEQALCRVGDIGLARVQDADMRLDVSRDIGGHAGACVPDDHDVCLHGLERIDRVENTFAFFARRRIDVEVQDVGSEALTREVERRPSSRAGFEKQIGDGPSGERPAVGGKAAGLGQVALSIVENVEEQSLVEILQGQQMTQVAILIEL